MALFFMLDMKYLFLIRALSFFREKMHLKLIQTFLKKWSLVFSLSLFLSLSFNNHLKAESYSRSDIESAYIYRISSHISWPNSKKIKTYNIHVIGDDDAFNNALKKISALKKIHNKKINVTHSTKIEIPDGIHVLYISNKFQSHFDRLLKSINSRSILIISQGFNDQRKIMVNLIEKENKQVSFEINKANIINNNLGVDPDVILLGGTEIDVAALYKEGQLKLKSNEKELEKINASLSQNMAELLRRKKTISELEKNISYKEERIETYEIDIKNIQGKINKDKAALDKQREEIKRQTKSIESRKKLLDSQFEEIVNKKNTIVSQIVQIKSQALQLESNKIAITEQKKTIERQRLTTTALTVFSLIILIMVVMLYRGFKKQRDISQQLDKAIDEAKLTSQHKSIFLAHMSHELRTPLNAIQGFSELLLRNKNLDDVQARNIKTIHNSGLHLLSLVNDILDMSKVESGKIEIELEDLDFYKLINDVSLMMEERAENKNLGWSTDVEKSIPQYIRADAAKIRQVLINLVGNAIKFTEHGSISLHFVTLNIIDGIAKISCRVKDTGSGMTQDDAESIFTPFVQLDNSSKQIGTGLGLSISHQYATLMKGDIKVESQINIGSTFDFTFDVNVLDDFDEVIDEDEKYAHVSGLTPGQSKYKILIVDDNKDNTLLLEQILHILDFDIRCEYNGADAITTFSQWKPDLIWMDWRMPVMDGLTATQKIRQLDDGNEVKIVALTANAFKEQREEILKAGCNEIVYKPYDAKDIFKCMTEQLDVEYIYENIDDILKSDKKVRLSSDKLNLLPDELKSALKQAAIELDTEALMTLTDEIEKIDAEQAQACRNAIKNYDLKAIFTAFEAFE